MISDKMKLVPVSVKWKAGAYGISITTQEADALQVETIVRNNDGVEERIAIRFATFAACRFFNFNFEEQHYDAFLIKAPSGVFVADTYDWKNEEPFYRETGICPNSGFYEVENTGWFEERSIYTKLKEKGFKHYILLGYDSYLEILANSI